MKNHVPDQRTFAFHKKAAEILLSQPERLAEANEVLANWLKMSGTQAAGWAEKWTQLTDGLSIKEIADLICREDEEMDFYRKSSPFSCLLSDDERMEIIQRIKYDK